MFTLKVSGGGGGEGGTTEGPNETIHDQRVFCHRDPISISTSGVHVLAITRRGDGLKQFLRSKQIFYRYSKPVCTFEREFYFRVSLLERGKRRGRGERERWGTKGATGILFSLLCPPPSSPPLHFIVSTIGQRTVLKWISIFPGVDLIKRGPDFRDGNIAGMHENWESFARNIKAFFERKRKGRREMSKNPTGVN